MFVKMSFTHIYKRIEIKQTRVSKWPWKSFSTYKNAYVKCLCKHEFYYTVWWYTIKIAAFYFNESTENEQ